VPVVQGPLRGARWIVGAHTHGCWLGHYEANLQRTLSQWVRPGDVVWDIGAHAGFFTLLAARLGATVIAVEPLPRNLAYLRRHLTLNRCGTVTVVEAALAEDEGTSMIYGDSAVAQIGTHGTPVRTTSLDRLVFGEGLPAPTVVKCDAEGSEGSILRGATRLLRERPPPVWLLSTHGAEQRDTCMSALRDADYRIGQRGPDPDDMIAVHRSVTASPPPWH
jgi:FkbM family methyltransferase